MSVNFTHKSSFVSTLGTGPTDADVVDIISEMSKATAIEDVWSCLTAFCATAGFDRLFYGFTNFRNGNSFGDPDDLLLLSNACGDYVKGFVEQEMFRKAPMVHWANANTGAQSWRLVAEARAQNRLTEDELEAVHFNQQHGVTCGFTVSFLESNTRNRGALALISPVGVRQEDTDQTWAIHGRRLLAVANVAHMKMTRLPHFGSRRVLTERQREVLAWVGDGKTTQDIATILGLTSATVEKHLRLARDVLDVDTTAQAVLKASVQNQIFMVSP